MNKKGRPKGHKLSIETRMKIAQSKLGNIQTEATRRKISNAVRRETKPAISIERIMTLDFKNAYKAQSGQYMNVYIPTDGVNPGRKMRYHVALMEQKLGRKLLPGEQVHHWGSKLNNNINLLTLCRDKYHHNHLDAVKAKLLEVLKKPLIPE